jgi:protein-tyrosine phosphatase
MCRIAAADGIRTIVASPHQQDGVYQTPANAIFTTVRNVAEHIRQAGIAIELLPGADVRVEVDTGEKILSGEIVSINNTKRYFLLEFPAHAIPMNIDKLIFNLLLKNITPILTHPERIHEVQEDPNRIFDLVAMGVPSQVTAMSIIGGFGRRAQKCARTLLTHNLAHIIATDAHSPDYRPPILSEAVKAVSKLLKDEERARHMVSTTPGRIIRGESVEIFPPPVKIQRKLFWFF